MLVFCYNERMIKIALYEPQIPPNTGNIARLAVGLDIQLILIGKLGFSIDDKRVKRAGLDYWKHLKLKQFATWQDFIGAEQGRIIIASTKGKSAYYNFKYKENDIILFGSETKGLPLEIIKDNLNNTVTIPMPGQVRSLNLSNSVSIIVYHALLKTDYFNNFSQNRNFKDLFI